MAQKFIKILSVKMSRVNKALKKRFSQDSELIEASSFEATKSKAGPTKKELTLCDFLRKDKETLTGSEVTSSVGDLESKTVTSSTGVGKRKLPDPAESSTSAEKRKKTNSEPSSSEAGGTFVREDINSFSCLSQTIP